MEPCSIALLIVLEVALLYLVTGKLFHAHHPVMIKARCKNELPEFAKYPHARYLNSKVRK